MPLSHQFSPPTKSKSHRGSVAILSLVWFAITAIGVGAISRATVVVHQRARAQTMVDAIALAAVDHGDTSARRFAADLGITEISIRHNKQKVTVVITVWNISAVSSALRPL